MDVSLRSLGRVHSCFREKFGIPRQSGLVAEARARIEILPPFDRDEAFGGLESFSHLWVIFVFHQCLRQDWKPTVRPPRLGGNRRMGVFASRSTFRPNPLGLSVVRFDGLRREQGRLYLEISGVDLLDGTPIVDIKPYLPWADSLPGARAGYAPEAPVPAGRLRFSELAEAQCREREKDYPQLRALIENLLRLDPRPAYRGAEQEGSYAMRLLDFDLRWRIRDGEIEVLALESTG